MAYQPSYRPGQRIGGRYLVHKAFVGGMGEVFLCLDEETIKPYALKTFQPRFQSANLKRLFEREGFARAGLQAPQVAAEQLLAALDGQRPPRIVNPQVDAEATS